MGGRKEAACSVRQLGTLTKLRAIRDMDEGMLPRSRRRARQHSTEDGDGSWFTNGFFRPTAARIAASRA